MPKLPAALVTVVVAGGALAGGAWLRSELTPAPAGTEAHAQAAKQDVTTPVAERVRRPDFQFVDQNGVARRISDWDGEVLVVNFWATWCAPCVEEIPFFIELQREYRARGVQFLGIAVDDLENVKPFAERFGFNYPTAAGDESAFELLRAYGNVIGGLPYTVLVDREGMVAVQHPGAISREELELAIRALLDSPSG